MKAAVVILLAALVPVAPDEGISRQRYDGWYNNIGHPRWGAADSDVCHTVPSGYGDMTYMPAGDKRPGARYLSNRLHSGPSGLPSYRNRTMAFVYFGQLLAADLERTSESSCPVELSYVAVSANDSAFPDVGSMSMPFERSLYNTHTGQSPNVPRKPINRVTSWIDANFIYGTSTVWANCLREFSGGRLSGEIFKGNMTWKYPKHNKMGLPLDVYPNPVDHSVPDATKLWMFGSKSAHMSPGLTALQLVWFRYHNYWAARVQADHPRWEDEMVFQIARQRVIATWQNIVYYEWLPELLQESLPEYGGYESHVEPGMDALFEAAALPFLITMVPPGVYLRNNECEFERPGNHSALRMCNVYWTSQDVLMTYGVDSVVMGMASQIAEREDHIMVEDVRGRSYGPLHFTRQDEAALRIMRGRDHGLADYVSVRKRLGLGTVDTSADINPWMYEEQKHELERLHDAYGGYGDMDVFSAGLFEFTPSGIGPLFRQVMVEQFSRLRTADRYWFENVQNKIFSREEVDEIRNTSFYDVIIAVTDVDPDSVQRNLFRWVDGDTCPQPSQLTETGDLEECTPLYQHDYFSGSELSYLLGWSSLCLFPFACLVAAYLVYRWQLFALKDIKGDSSTKRTSRDGCSTGLIVAQEWLGDAEGFQTVSLEFQDATHILILNACTSKGRSVKTDFTRMGDVPLWLSNDKSRTVALLHRPRGYDLVLSFRTESDRTAFVTQLRDILPEGRSAISFECRERYIYKTAVTKERRQNMLTEFFKIVFSEAYKMDELAPIDGINIEKCRNVADCELTREEFAEALAMTPDSLFITQMFELIDKDGKDYISFRDMIYTVALFTKGSVDDKLRILFLMYDLDGNGSLSQDEVGKMIRSMLDMAHTDISSNEVEELQRTMLKESGLGDKPTLSFEDFRVFMSGHMDEFNDVSLEWKGLSKHRRGSKSPMGGSSPMASKRKYSVSSVLSMSVRAIRDSQGPMRRKLQGAYLYLENNKQHIIYVLAFFCVCGLLFAERFYMYAVEREEHGFRSIMGYGLSLTRGAAAAMSFCFSLMLVTMCRNLITALRDTMVNFYVPFDSHVAFHKIVAYTALVFTGMHILGYCFNFYNLTTQPAQFLCVFDEVFFSLGTIPSFVWWLFGNLTGATGYLLVLVLCVIYIFATQTARKYIFGAFWITHKLYYVLYILILLHGSVHIVQEAYFPYYFMGPAVMFTIDKIVSLSRKKRKLDIINVDLLPSNVTRIVFKRPQTFEYKSGQWVRIACLPLGENSYHPFTLTSSPHEDTLSVHIRAVGPWTKNIRTILNPRALNDKPFPKLYLDGPYGAGQQDWYRYDVSILVGGGIGVTPYASILKDFVFMNSVKNTFKIRCKKLYFIWVAGSLQQWEWLVDILRQVEEVDHRDVVNIHVFVTQLFQDFDLRTTMLYICEEHFKRMTRKSMFTGLKAVTLFGRPNFEEIFVTVAGRHPKVNKIGVFSCGPPAMTKGVEKACHKSSGQVKALFEHHYENF